MEVKVGSGRLAAQGISFKESGVDKTDRADLLEVKEEDSVADETAALEATSVGSTGGTSRRLSDFSVIDMTDDPQPLQTLHLAKGPLFLTGIVYPLHGTVNKENGKRVEGKFGPIKGFKLDLTGSEANILLFTDICDYICMRPSSVYKKLFMHLSEQADMTYEVYQALNPSSGGSLGASFEEVVARLARSKIVKSYAGPREGLLLCGKFVLAQLLQLDEASSTPDITFADSLFATTLHSELENYKYISAVQRANAGIHIKSDDGQVEQPAVLSKPSDPKGKGKANSLPGVQELLADADEDLARQIQAKFDQEDKHKQLNGGRPRSSTGPAYIKVSEAEIADDYPLPTPYSKNEEEMDELLLWDEELLDYDPEYLPRRTLTDFAIYNADGLMATLELLPMWSGVDPDVELFASGVVLDDDGDFSGGQTLEPTEEAGGSGAAGSSDTPGMRLFLSQIKEWVVDFGADMLFISLRTDVAWYRLSVPNARYSPWFNVVLKAARMAVRVLQMLASENRASKLSFSDVIKKLAVLDENDPIFVSKKADVVERFVVVHGQIILNQFRNFPLKEIKDSAFVSQLRDRMQILRHIKLYKAPKAKRSGGVNRNPMKDRAAGARSKPMTATATAMVKSIWQVYFNVYLTSQDEQPLSEGGVAKEVEEDENEEDNENDATEDALAASVLSSSPSEKKKTKNNKKAAAPANETATIVGEPASIAGNTTFYSKLKIADVTVSVGDTVELKSEEGEEMDVEAEPTVAYGLLQALWQSGSKETLAQIRILVKGTETVLGDAASDNELFLTSRLVTLPLTSIIAPCIAKKLDRPWDQTKRAEHFAEDNLLRTANAEAAGEGKPLQFIWRRQYIPEKGMFCDLPKDLKFGERLSEDSDESPVEGVQSLPDGAAFVKNGVTYTIGDYVFVSPGTFDQLQGAIRDVQLPDFLANSKFHKGSHEGLRAWGIGQLISISKKKSKTVPKKRNKKKKDASDSDEDLEDGGDVQRLTVRRFYRPEDISEEAAYHSESYYDIYSSDEKADVDVDAILGLVKVLPPGYKCDVQTFRCIGSFDRATSTLGPCPKTETFVIPDDAIPEPSDKGKSAGKTVEKHENDGISLATMDIFAGCGGLSEGMHQAGAATTKWAIEYEYPAAEAFKLNNPDAAVFCNNCNVLLYAAMAKAGLESDCLASTEAVEESAKLPEDQLQSLPLPGEVDFICGGPPCQGYSGMNRFNKGNWSMVQNSMVMAFLSYCDFYRPRYFLLENVRNFVSHNKSFTFRLTLRSLLDMGYQVRFGVLNAGNFGVSQSRKRTFIWAAAPGELLPDWPRLMHCFRSPQLTINLPGNVQYTAVPITEGAPLRPITVKDAIGDLPMIGNGASADDLEYVSAPVSSFQKYIRNGADRLRHHVSKQMNDLNLERCRSIPKNCPGADWRCLEEIVRNDPTREKFEGQDLVPWCLPNTADRHNGWRGLFGRLDWGGHFPTSTTDPQPMGKVGQVFHPEQDRIVSVRECARAQGFPDTHLFYGNVHSMHRQVGNAVPPPLAAALGRELRKKLEETASAAARERLLAFV